MSKTEQHKIWEIYATSTLKAVRRECLYADRLDAVKIIDEIIAKRLGSHSKNAYL